MCKCLVHDLLPSFAHTRFPAGVRVCLVLHIHTDAVVSADTGGQGGLESAGDQDREPGNRVSGAAKQRPGADSATTYFPFSSLMIPSRETLSSRPQIRHTSFPRELLPERHTMSHDVAVVLHPLLDDCPSFRSLTWSAICMQRYSGEGEEVRRRNQLLSRPLLQDLLSEPNLTVSVSHSAPQPVYRQPNARRLGLLLLC